MERITDELNYDFNFLTTCITKFLAKLNDPNDRKLVCLWQEKLSNCGQQSSREAQLRNDFLFYLCRCCADGRLAPPFTEQPPKGKLLSFQHLLPAESGPSERKTKSPRLMQPTKQTPPLSEIFDKSPDKGAFLVSQPVPRCGAFCYLAIVNRAPPK